MIKNVTIKVRCISISSISRFYLTQKPLIKSAFNKCNILEDHDDKLVYNLLVYYHHVDLQEITTIGSQWIMVLFKTKNCFQTAYHV